MKNDPRGFRSILKILAILSVGLMCQPILASTWSQLTITGTGPTTRQDPYIVYVPNTNQMIVYGGSDANGNYPNDVWILNNANGLGGTPFWSLLTVTGTLPQLNSDKCSIYDEAHNRMIMYGGLNDGFVYHNEVWVLVNANGTGDSAFWTQLITSGTTPTATAEINLAYDSTNNRLILTGTSFDDMWILTNANGLGGTPVWSKLTTSITGSSPSYFAWNPSVYDAVNNVLMMVVPDTTWTYTDVWILSNANGLGGKSIWTKLYPNNSKPPCRNDASAIYDPVDNFMIIFGGFAIDSGFIIYLNDTWLLSNANGIGTSPTWTQITTQGSIPAPRYEQTCIWDSTNHRMILYGGEDDSKRIVYNDTWVLSLDTLGGYGCGYLPLQFHLPDIKLVVNQGLTSALDLADFNTGGVASNYSIVSNFLVLSTLTGSEVYQPAYSSPTMGMNTYQITDSYNNTTTVNQMLKYSTYVLSKLPRIIVKNGTVLENGLIDLSDYVTPGAPLEWPEPEIHYVSDDDIGKVSAIISSNTISISVSTVLSNLASAIITATPDFTTNNWDKEIIKIYEVMNDYGFFDKAEDTVEWAYEDAPYLSDRANVSYLDTYNVASGVIQISFDRANQGIKMTPLRSHWLVSSTGQWYTIRMRVMSDSPGNTFVTNLFLYNGDPGVPFDVSADVLLSIPTTWTWMETSLYCESSDQLFPQFYIKNANSLGSLYIDALEIIAAKPGIELAYGNTRIPNDSANWDNYFDILNWAIEAPYGSVLASTGLEDCGGLNVTFTGSGVQGVKVTGKYASGQPLTFPVTPGKSAGMKMNIATSGTLKYPFTLVSVFATDSEHSQNFTEMGATAAVWKIPQSGQLETTFVPSQPYIFAQFQVKNSGSGQFTVDNTYLYSDQDIINYWNYDLFK